MIRAILFDFGNVIAFFDHFRAIEQIAGQCRMTPTEIFSSIYDGPLEHDFESGRIGGADFLHRMKEIIGYNGSVLQLEAAFIEIFTPNPAVTKLIPTLAKNHRLVLASNTNILHSARFRVQLADTLQHFHALGMSFEAGVRKPAAAFYDHCLRLADCPAEEAVFVDDVAGNVAGAAAVGLRAIRYGQEVDLAKSLREIGARI